MRFTSDEFDEALANYRHENFVPEGETDILMEALKVAAAVTREGVIEGVLSDASEAAEVRRVLTEPGT